MNDEREKNGRDRAANDSTLEIIHAVSFSENAGGHERPPALVVVGSDLHLLELLENGTSVIQFFFVRALVLLRLFHGVGQASQITNQIFG